MQPSPLGRARLRPSSRGRTSASPARAAPGRVSWAEVRPPSADGGSAFSSPSCPWPPLPLPAGVCGVRLGQGSLLCERGRPLSPACPVAAPRRDGFSSLWLAHLSHRFCSWVTLLAAEEPACRWPSVE